MIDTFHIPGATKENQQIFYCTGSTNNWQLWEKPRGASMHFMLVVGSGAGGGAGFTGTSTTARGGGGGGGSSPVSRLIIPSIAIPDRLYVQVGIGGAGGPSSGSAGSNGAASRIDAETNVSVLISIGVNAGGGAAGSLIAGGAGGSGGAAATQASMALSSFGSFTAQVGQAGGAGGAQTGAAGTNISPLVNIPTSSGAGGGGTTSADFKGGDINAFNFLPLLPGGAAGSNPGSSGIILSTGRYPLIYTGGSGGGASNAGVGGAGGNGAIGSGGGGGGAGTTGGAGGRGGDGLVIIISW